MNRSRKNPLISEHPITFLLINFTLVAILLSCFALVIDKFINEFYLEWRGNILPVMAFFVALECLITQYLQRNSSSGYGQRIIPTLVEIILLLMIIKLISMFTVHFFDFWREIISWGQDFFLNFFDLDYLLLSSGLIGVWMLAYFFSQDLIKLDIDKDLLDQEKQIVHANSRQVARQDLIRMIFILGFIIIFLMAVLESNLIYLSMDQNITGFLVPTLIIYFFVAFIFLALNQYAILQAHWYFEDIQANSNLINHWLLFSLLLCLGVILLIIFLPTNFTLNFKPIAQALVQAILYVIYILHFIILIAYTFIFTLIDTLFKDIPFQEELEKGISEIQPLPSTVTAPLPWLEALRTIVFWLIFLSVIIFSIVFYVINRKQHIKGLKFSQLFDWVKEFWKFIKEIFRNFSRGTVQTINTSLKKIKTIFNNQPIQLPSLQIFSQGESPRQKAINAYVNWIQWNQVHGFARSISQTPFEYANEITNFLPEAAVKIDQLTYIFILARYSKHAITKAEVQEMDNLRRLLQKNFLERQNSENQEKTE